MKTLFLILLLPIMLFNIYLTYRVFEYVTRPIISVERPVPHDPWPDIQNWRVANNKLPYMKSPDLCELADARVYQLVTDWSHNGFFPMIKPMRYVQNGENLSKDIIPDNVLGAWLDSPKHKELLEAEYPYACVVCNGRFCVLEVGR